MSTVLEAIEKQHATERVERFTRELVGRNGDVRWRYDLLNSQFSPAQYYAVALRGTGPDAEEILVIAIECSLYRDERGPLLGISATITDGDGAILAEAENESTAIRIPSGEYLQNHPERAMEIAKAIQGVFDLMVDWVNGQAGLIDRVLQQGNAQT